MKTITSPIHDADARQQLWTEIAEDKQALLDRNKTREEALCLVSYFEGKYDGLVDAKRILKL